MSDGIRIDREDQALKDQVISLFERGHKLMSLGLRTLLAGVAVGVFGLGMLVLAHHAAPVTELTAVDVPSSILNKLSDVVTHVGSGGGAFGTSGELSGFSSQVSSFQDVIFGWAVGPVALVIGIFLLTGGGAMMIYASDSGMLPRMAVMTGVLMMTANMMTIFTGSGGTETIESERNEFVAALERKDFSNARQKLYGKNGLDADYVRAQMALIEKSPQPDLYRSVATRLDEKPDFTPENKVAYLIDLAAFNQVKGEIAREYWQESMERVSSRHASAIGSFVLAAILVTCAIALVLIARTLIKRVHRIDDNLAVTLKAKMRHRKEPDPEAV